MTEPDAPRLPSSFRIALLSLLVPGWGHLHLGQRKKGLAILIGTFFTCALCGLWNVLAALDAWGLARKRARGEPIGEFENARLADWLDSL